MYQSHFGLTKPPFGLTPDTSFFFVCVSYQEALNTLLVAVRNGEGLIKITGEVGNGKTMLCRKFLATLDENFVVANIFRPCLDPYHLLLTLAEEFAIPLPVNADQHQLLKLITNKLMDYARSNKYVVVCLDEAQTMSLETLETLRLLTNLETENYKLLQVVLFGQPELDERLANKSMRQLRQRITFQHHLGGLLESELEQYLNHRLNVAGFQGGRVYSSAAIRLMCRVTGGIPRLVNIIANKSLLLAYGEGTREVLPLHVRHAAIDTPEAKFDWLAVRTNKFAVICQNGGQRSAEMGLINKVLLDLQKRGGVRESLGQASACLCAAPSYLRLSKVPMLAPIILSLLVASAIWGILNSQFWTASTVQSKMEVTKRMEAITDFSIGNPPAKLSVHESLGSPLLESKAQILPFSAAKPGLSLTRSASFHIVPPAKPGLSLTRSASSHIVPPAKPVRVAEVSENLMLENEDAFQSIPANKPTTIAAAADETMIETKQVDVDLLMGYEDQAMTVEPIVVASIAEDNDGLLSSIPEPQEAVAMMHPVESVFSDQIVKQVNSRQQIEHEFQQAILLAQQGRINEALNKYDQILQLDATHETARHAMVGLLLKSRRLDEVERILQAGIRLSAGHTEFAKTLSRIQVEKGNIEAALDTLQHSLPQALNQPDYRAFMGALLQRQSRHKEAIEHYRAAVNLSPSAGVWLMGLGISLQEEGHFAEAHEAFRRAQMSRDLNEDLLAFVDRRIRQIRRKIY